MLDTTLAETTKPFAPLGLAISPISRVPLAFLMHFTISHGRRRLPSCETFEIFAAVQTRGDDATTGKFYLHNFIIEYPCPEPDFTSAKRVAFFWSMPKRRRSAAFDTNVWCMIGVVDQMLGWDMFVLDYVNECSMHGSHVTKTVGRSASPPCTLSDRVTGLLAASARPDTSRRLPPLA